MTAGLPPTSGRMQRVDGDGQARAQPRAGEGSVRMSADDMTFRSRIRDLMRLPLWIGWAALFGGIAASGQAVRGNGMDEFFFAPVAVSLLIVGALALVRVRTSQEFAAPLTAYLGAIGGIENWYGLVSPWARYGAPVAVALVIALARRRFDSPG